MVALLELAIPTCWRHFWSMNLASRLFAKSSHSIARNLRESLTKSFDGDVFAVELIERETWDKMAPKVIDFGFLRVEPDREQILYEGNLERWPGIQQFILSNILRKGRMRLRLMLAEGPTRPWVRNKQSSRSNGWFGSFQRRN